VLVRGWSALGGTIACVAIVLPTFSLVNPLPWEEVQQVEPVERPPSSSVYL